jgi:hypothetical protein
MRTRNPHRRSPERAAVLVIAALAVAACGTQPSAPVQSAPGTLAAGRCWAYTQAGATQAVLERKAKALASSPCNGNSWVLDWRYLEPAPGQYRWQLVDAAISDSAATGKPVFLRVLAGINSPAWVFSVAHPIAIPATTYTPAGTLPAPWDRGFLNAWEAFIAAYGARYDGNPYIALIETAGTGIYGESYLPGGAQIWEAAGYTETIYEATIEEIVERYLTAFTHTPIALDVSIGVVGVGGQNVMAPLVAWVSQHYRTRVYMQQNGLSATTVAGRQAVTKTPLFGLQMVGPTSQSRTGSLCAAFAVALADKAEYVEVYYSDVINAANYGALRYLINGRPSEPC